jgi:hypothetical protein
MDDPQISLRPEPPPLRIHHLMACSAATAVMFTLWRTVAPPIDMLGGARAAMMAVWGGLTSIGVTFAIFSVYWHSRGYAGLTQPGQWLLIGFAIAVLRSIASMLFVAVVRADSDLWLPYRVVTALMSSSIIPLVFYLCCAWKVADTRAWRMAFVVLGVVPIVGSALMFYQAWGISISGMYSAAVASEIVQNATKMIAVGLAALGDRSGALQRYWTHWLGVGLFVLVCVSSVLGTVISLIYL